jgi:hypothetical protein
MIATQQYAWYRFCTTLRLRWWHMVSSHDLGYQMSFDHVGGAPRDAYVWCLCILPFVWYVFPRYCEVSCWSSSFEVLEVASGCVLAGLCMWHDSTLCFPMTSWTRDRYLWHVSSYVGWMWLSVACIIMPWRLFLEFSFYEGFQLPQVLTYQLPL